MHDDLTTRTRAQERGAAERREAAEVATESDSTGRFRDEAWDDEFCTWLDGGLRTCCG